MDRDRYTQIHCAQVNPRDRSASTYTQAADCWSCGITLYVMLVGQFPGKVGSDVVFDPEIMKHLSPSAVTLLKQMLATDPAVRINVQQASRAGVHVMTKIACDMHARTQARSAFVSVQLTATVVSTEQERSVVVLMLYQLMWRWLSELFLWLSLIHI